MKPGGGPWARGRAEQVVWSLWEAGESAGSIPDP